MKVLVRKTSYEKAVEFVSEAFEMFRIEKLIDSPVYIKPNFLKFADPESGCITHPKVVKAVIEVLKELDYDVFVVEGSFSGNAASRCFEAFKLSDIAKCVDLNADEFIEIAVEGESLKSVSVAKTALEARKNYISLPKLKVHHLTMITVGIKNNMGFLKKPADYMHFDIHRKLVDLLNVFMPKLTIVDGVIGGERSELWTKPVQHGVMVASNNVVACDVVAASLMGFDLAEVKHVALAAKKFDVLPEKIKIVGDDVESLKRKYSV